MIRNAFFGLTTARHGLLAEQRAMDLVGRNVANANTPGYTRQSVSAAPVVGGAAGTGGQLLLHRHRDGLLDRMYRQRSSDLGYASARQDSLRQVEVVWGEMSEFGLRSELARFWDALQDLANRPADFDTRTQVLQRADSLTGLVNNLFRQMEEHRRELDNTLAGLAEEVNRLAQQVAALNQQVLSARTTGSDSAALEDRRDLLLDQLAGLTGSTVMSHEDGQVSVWMGGTPLVQGPRYDQMVLRPGDEPGVRSLRWQHSGDPESPASEVRLPGGRMRGLLQSRDEEIPRYGELLRQLALGLAEAFNAVHREGFDQNGSPGLDFFAVDGLSGSSWRLAVNSEVAGYPERVAAAGSPAGQADAGNARRLSDLRDQLLLAPPGATEAPPVTVDAFYRLLVARMGLDTQEATRRVETLQLQERQLDERRMAVSGVSVDEEMALLILHQRAYQAAARTLTTMDEALDVLINRMGLVGR